MFHTRRDKGMGHSDRDTEMRRYFPQLSSVEQMHFQCDARPFRQFRHRGAHRPHVGFPRGLTFRCRGIRFDCFGRTVYLMIKQSGLELAPSIAVERQIPDNAVNIIQRVRQNAPLRRRRGRQAQKSILNNIFRQAIISHDPPGETHEISAVCREKREIFIRLSHSIFTPRPLPALPSLSEPDRKCALVACPPRVSCASVLTAIKAAPLRCSETHAGRGPDGPLSLTKPHFRSGSQEHDQAIIASLAPPQMRHVLTFPYR